MAEQTLDFINDFRIQFQNFFQNLTFGKKLFLFSTLAIVVLGLLALIYFSSQTTWSPLVSGIAIEDASLITKKLDEQQIPYIIQGGGTGILVPADMLDRVRLDIASSGIQMGGIVGLEIFDKDNLAATEFQQKVQYKRAIEGELSRLVSKIKTIKSAKISVAFPERSLFLENEKHPSASVVLEMSGNNNLSKKGVDTIITLVAGAIPGMQKEHVTVSDQKGNLLTKGTLAIDDSETRTRNVGYQQAIENRLEQKALSQLEKIVGKDRVEVRITAKIDFDSSESVEELVDPDASALLSEEVSSEKSTGSRSIPVGVPGVVSNAPEVRAGASEVANVSDVNKKTRRTNFVNSKKHVVKKKASGEVQRISVAVILDGKYEYVRNDTGEVVGDPVYKAWNPQELEDIERIVKVAVGFNQQRGDTIQVRNIRFHQQMFEIEHLKAQKTKARNAFIVDIIKFIFVGVIFLVVVLMIIRPMVQKLSAKPEDLDLLMGLPTTIGELEGEELEIPTEGEAGIPPREKIVEFAKQDPLKTASMIRTWLRDKK